VDQRRRFGEVGIEHDSLVELHPVAVHADIFGIRDDAPVAAVPPNREDLRDFLFEVVFQRHATWEGSSARALSLDGLADLVADRADGGFDRGALFPGVGDRCDTEQVGRDFDVAR